MLFGFFRQFGFSCWFVDFGEVVSARSWLLIVLVILYLWVIILFLSLRVVLVWFVGLCL